MTILDEFLSRKSIKKTDAYPKTDNSISRLRELSRNESQLKVKKLLIISLAVNIEPTEVLNNVLKSVKLNNVN